MSILYPIIIQESIWKFDREAWIGIFSQEKSNSGFPISSNYVIYTGMGIGTLLTGILIFLARIVDVSLGTVRTISIVQGRVETAFLLGFVEVSVWLAVIASVMDRVKEKPILGVFYALGFSTGNAVGILLEDRVSFGHIVLRIISPQRSREMAEQIRGLGHAVTTFQGEGASGPVTELYVMCRKSDLKRIVALVKCIEPDAFYTTEKAGVAGK
ncbi:MAG: DUF5698 domain-containing protein [bacterium]